MEDRRHSTVISRHDMAGVSNPLISIITYLACISCVKKGILKYISVSAVSSVPNIYKCSFSLFFLPYLLKTSRSL